MTSEIGYNLGLSFPVCKMFAWDERSNVAHSYLPFYETLWEPEFEPHPYTWVENESLVSLSLRAVVTWYWISISSSSPRLLTGVWNHPHGLLSLPHPQPGAICRGFQFGDAPGGERTSQSAPCQPQPCCPQLVPDWAAFSELFFWEGKWYH